MLLQVFLNIFLGETCASSEEIAYDFPEIQLALRGTSFLSNRWRKTFKGFQHPQKRRAAAHREFSKFSDVSTRRCSRACAGATERISERMVMFARRDRRACLGWVWRKNENAALQWGADAVCLEAVSELTVFGSRFWVQDLYPKKCLESKRLDSSWFLKYPVDPSKMMAIWRTCAPKKTLFFYRFFKKKHLPLEAVLADPDGNFWTLQIRRLGDSELKMGVKYCWWLKSD